MLKKIFCPRGQRVFILTGRILILGFAFCGLALAGTGPDLVLVAPQAQEGTPVRAGGPVRFLVVLTNGDAGAAPVPQKLSLTLTPESGAAIDVAARPVTPAAMTMVPGKGFLNQAYEFSLPAAVVGLVSISAPGSNTAMFYAGPPAKKDTVAAAPAKLSEKAVSAYSPLDLQQQFQPFFVNFSSYKPVYFLFGLDPGIEKSSFQISFKYKLFDFGETSFAGKYLSGLENIHLAYTQQSFWDLDSDSAPFEDSRYMPEVFYLNTDLGIDLPGLIASGFQAGLQHESNGRSGDQSRSTNYGYIQPFLAFKLTDRIHIKLAPKAWVYVRNEKESNPDLADYRGYFDLETKIGVPEGLALENHFRHGKKGGTWQLDLSYPLDQIPGFKGFLDMYIHAQFFSGYSDTLLNYDQREDVIRLGFSLVR